jgi:hypothetical protein
MRRTSRVRRVDAGDAVGERSAAAAGDRAFGAGSAAAAGDAFGAASRGVIVSAAYARR